MLDPLPAPRPRTSALAAIIVALQIAFSAAFVGANIVAERTPGRLVDSVLAAESAPRPHPASEENFASRELPAHFCCSTAPVIARTQLTAADVAIADLAVLIPSAHDNALLYVDSELVSGLGTPTTQTTTSRRPHLLRIPPRYKRDGAIVDVVVTRNVGFGHLRPMSVGSYEALYPSYLALRLLRADLPFINAVVAAFVAIFCICAAPLLGARGLLFSLGGLASGWMLQQAGQLVTDPPWGPVASIFLYLVGFLATLLFVCWFFVEWTSAFAPNKRQHGVRGLLIDSWDHKARQRMGMAVLGLLLLGIGLMLWRLSAGDTMIAIQDIDRVLGYLGFAALIICFVRLAAYATRGGLREPLEMSAFIFVLLAAGADIAMVRFLHTYGVFLGVAVAFFPLALMISLAGRARTIFEAATANAERLNTLVGQREREIVANLEELRRRERASVLLEERGRIMRDMHDGIGGHLLGLVLQAKSDTLSNEQLVQGLEESIADLRIIVDSLEQDHASLATTLGAFRARIEPRVLAAGARLIWDIGDVEGANHFGPDRALQLYRILQEACTNALRHGRPDEIAVRLASVDQVIELSVSDNGGGFDPATARTGRGLANMEHRAALIGAKLHIESAPGSTRVILRI